MSARRDVTLIAMVVDDGGVVRQRVHLARKPEDHADADPDVRWYNREQYVERLGRVMGNDFATMLREQWPDTEPEK